MDLSKPERNLVKDLQFCKNTTNQARHWPCFVWRSRGIRRSIIFNNLSEHLSYSLAIRVGRYRFLDPAVVYNTDPELVAGRWHKRDRPRIVADGCMSVGSPGGTGAPGDTMKKRTKVAQ